MFSLLSYHERLEYVSTVSMRIHDFHKIDPKVCECRPQSDIEVDLEEKSTI